MIKNDLLVGLLVSRIDNRLEGDKHGCRGAR